MYSMALAILHMVVMCGCCVIRPYCLYIVVIRTILQIICLLCMCVYNRIAQLGNTKIFGTLVIKQTHCEVYLCFAVCVCVFNNSRWLNKWKYSSRGKTFRSKYSCYGESFTVPKIYGWLK